ncbi:LppU/SCO3897 family protein [Streptomyces erythrochromogenes]|uniref:LppU/SCO3897 family protein n=1 Tax=Streptomyces erythrochromogenes TaxID=285574 RepID=UPI0036939AFC
MATPPAPQTPEQPAVPGPAGAPVAPSEPAKKKSGLGKKILGVLVAIAIALFWRLGLPHLTGDAPVHAEAGDCVVVTGPENDPKVESSGCTEKVADLYKVVKVFDNTFDIDKCEGVAEVALAQQLETDKFVLCMEPVKN